MRIERRARPDAPRTPRRGRLQSRIVDHPAGRGAATPSRTNAISDSRPLSLVDRRPDAIAHAAEVTNRAKSGRRHLEQTFAFAAALRRRPPHPGPREALALQAVQNRIDGTH